MVRKPNRALQTQRGQQTIKRVKTRISAHYIAPEITEGKGTYSSPDLIVTVRQIYKYGIEVKRVQNIYSYRKGTKKCVGNAAIYRKEWDGLLEWCQENHATPLLIVEIYIPQSRKGHLYFKIRGHIITTIFDIKKVYWLSLTVWDIIRLGEKI